mmetsp:Transcript_97682/g.246424  ORF Transcript_97682/g.246424 Transcript_97682/m.246424 type:complete len:215 (-) Transcript_97682:987-1631(-)
MEETRVLEHGLPLLLADGSRATGVDLLEECLEPCLPLHVLLSLLNHVPLSLRTARSRDHVVADNRSENRENGPVGQNHEANEEELAVHGRRDRAHDVRVAVHQPEEREERPGDGAEILLDGRRHVSAVDQALADQARPKDGSGIQHQQREQHHPLHGSQRLDHSEQQRVQRLDCPKEADKSEDAEDARQSQQLHDAHQLVVCRDVLVAQHEASE